MECRICRLASTYCIRASRHHDITTDAGSRLPFDRLIVCKTKTSAAAAFVGYSVKGKRRCLPPPPPAGVCSKWFCMMPPNASYDGPCRRQDNIPAACITSPSNLPLAKSPLLVHLHSVSAPQACVVCPAQFPGFCSKARTGSAPVQHRFSGGIRATREFGIILALLLVFVCTARYCTGGR